MRVVYGACTILIVFVSLEEIKEAIKSRVYRQANGQWGCTECDFSSNRASVVSVHVEAKHLETGGFVCPICHKHCPTRNSLDIHKYRYHRNVQH